MSSVRLRASLYDSDRSESRLFSGSIGLEPWNGAHLEAGGGVRETRDPFVGLTDRAAWESVDADVALGGRWFVLASWDHERGDVSALQRILLGLQRSW